MRIKFLVMAGVAVMFSLAAALMANSLLNGAAPKSREAAVEVRMKTGTIVVAKQPLRYGIQLTRGQLREIDWPTDDVPAGAFASIDELFAADKDRYVLSAIEPNEPVLDAKITGPGQRATLSAVVGEGLRAMTIRVNDVHGVGGFVLPGEKVDVLVTGEQDHVHFTDIMVQNVRVLAVDQLADDRTTNPMVAKAVTLEVTAAQSQKIALGSAIGQLSLALRHAGESVYDTTKRLTALDLRSSEPQPDKAPVLASAPVSRDATIGVRRGVERQEYSVSRSVSIN